jgi:hypothetical protein
MLPATQIGIRYGSIDDLDEVGHSVSIGASRFSRCPLNQLISGSGRNPCMTVKLHEWDTQPS